MSASRKEPQHLEALYEAKQRFKRTLMPRITSYEERLKKPFFKRGSEYLKTGYGQKGYDRTKNFLAAMDEENISRTEHLIDLTNKYTEGNALPLLLRATVLVICKFSNDHVSQVERDLTRQTWDKYPNKKDALLVLLTIRNQAINHIYKQIMDSQDYGGVYLESLNRKLRIVQFTRPK